MTSAVHKQLVQGALKCGALEFGEYPIQGGKTRPYSFDVSKLLAMEELAEPLNEQISRLYDDSVSFNVLSLAEKLYDGFFSSNNLHLSLPNISTIAKSHFGQVDVAFSNELKGKKSVCVFISTIGSDSESQQVIKTIEKDNGCIVKAIFTIFATQETGQKIPKQREDVPIFSVLTLDRVIHHLPPGQNKHRIEEYRDKHAPSILKPFLTMELFRHPY